MNPNLKTVNEKVQKIVTSRFSHVEIAADGELSFANGSARAFIMCWSPDEDGAVVINVTAPILFNVEPSPELFKHIALHADDYIFAHLSAKETPEGIRVSLTHCLLGDYLDEEELVTACGSLLVLADDIDDNLKSQFGGRLFYEED